MKSFTLILASSFLLSATAGASEVGSLTSADHDLRIVPQLVVGTAGVEPGVALEYRTASLNRMIIRPEVFLNEDSRVGGGGALLYNVGESFDLPHEQALAFGPRLVSHNSDKNSWEFDAMATYGISLSSMTQPWRHAVGLLAAVGVRHDKEHDEARIGANGGIFYSFRF